MLALISLGVFIFLIYSLNSCHKPPSEEEHCIVNALKNNKYDFFVSSRGGLTKKKKTLLTKGNQL